MSKIQLIVDDEIVYTHDTGCSAPETVEPTQKAHTLAPNAVTECQVRKSGNGVYFQARFAKGDRQSVHLTNVNLNGLVQSKSKNDKAPRLSYAGTGNHYYTPAILNGSHVFADGIHIGDVPESWDKGRK